MKLHGHIMHVTPGAELAPGVCDMSWRIYETNTAGIDSVEDQIAEDWTWERIDFVWGEDLRDYCGLHGLCVFLRTNMPVESGEVRLGRNKLDADFIFCGQLYGVAMPFHTAAQAYEIIEWFVTKQEQWHAIYPQLTEREAAEDAKAEKANPGTRSKKRGSRPSIH